MQKQWHPGFVRVYLSKPRNTPMALHVAAVTSIFSKARNRKYHSELTRGCFVPLFLYCFYRNPQNAEIGPYLRAVWTWKFSLLPLCSFRSVASLHCIIYHNLQHRSAPCLASQNRSHSSVYLQRLTQDMEQQRCSGSGCRRKGERMEVGRETGRLTWRCTGFLRLQEIKEKGKKGTNIY